MERYLYKACRKVEKLKARFAEAMVRKGMMETEEQYEYEVGVFGTIRDKSVSHRIGNKIHINQNFNERVHAEIKQLLEERPYLFSVFKQLCRA